MGQWFSDSRVLQNDSKNCLECRVQVLVSGIQTLWVWGKDLGIRILISFPMILIQWSPGLPLRNSALGAGGSETRLCLQGSASPGGFGFLRLFVWEQMCMCTVKGSQPLHCLALLSLFFSLILSDFSFQIICYPTANGFAFTFLLLKDTKYVKQYSVTFICFIH